MSNFRIVGNLEGINVRECETCDKFIIYSDDDSDKVHVCEKCNDFWCNKCKDAKVCNICNEKGCQSCMRKCLLCRKNFCPEKCQGKIRVYVNGNIEMGHCSKC